MESEESHAIPLALKIEERATSQGMEATSGSWKRQENGLSPEESKRKVALHHLNFKHPTFSILVSLTTKSVLIRKLIGQ